MQLITLSIFLYILTCDTMVLHARSTRHLGAQPRLWGEANGTLGCQIGTLGGDLGVLAFVFGRIE